jgi:hypothetical protein
MALRPHREYRLNIKFVHPKCKILYYLFVNLRFLTISFNGKSLAYFIGRSHLCDKTHIQIISTYFSSLGSGDSSSVSDQTSDSSHDKVRRV